jgi:2'-5' RNA ligase
MLNVKYDFSSVHVDVPPTLADSIIQWGKKQIKDEDIYVSAKEATLGRENEIHATVLYGIHSSSADQSIKLLKDTGPIKAKLGKTGIFIKPRSYDVIMIEIESSDLNRLNELLIKNIKHTNKYGLYKPHVTIAYVKKGKAWKHVNNLDWCGMEFTCDEAVFSSKNGSKHRFSL